LAELDFIVGFDVRMAPPSGPVAGKKNGLPLGRAGCGVIRWPYIPT
jgi:hypothetical protein